MPKCARGLPAGFGSDEESDGEGGVRKKKSPGLGMGGLLSKFGKKEKKPFRVQVRRDSAVHD